MKETLLSDIAAAIEAGFDGDATKCIKTVAPIDQLELCAACCCCLVVTDPLSHPPPLPICPVPQPWAMFRK